MASIEEGVCRDDNDCPQKQYCYDVSARCVDYTECRRYNRQENRERKARHPSQCGPCLFGFSAEELGTGEMAWLCKKSNVPKNVPDVVGRLNNITIICITGGVLIVFLLLIIGVIIYLRKRTSKRRNNNPEQCGDLCVTEPSAPPVETSPFISYGEELAHVPCNNNKNLKDRNNLVSASPFKTPSWVRPNPNYETNLSNENRTIMGQLQSVVEVPPADDQSNPWPPEQLTLEVTNGNVVQYEIEQVDNNTNTVLVQTSNPSSSSTSHEEENNNNPRNSGSTPESGNGENRERLRASNILISQKISMNVNLLNND
ncbi:uncharacterized protein LOC100879467 isoform X2 [Megachile rotundata]|uniref:uncharacterized protein LOC100879467 isoform X2 n=1 Tax=Megachile rotundata TaxID=143995 RepID=UPI000614DAAA|nr:PREDICTED: uncharacterized protein LOC100879467 isoform X2 [Megachile rotundata]